MENTNEVTLDEMKARLSTLDHETWDEIETFSPDLESPYLQAASVLIFFEPYRLAPVIVSPEIEFEKAQEKNWKMELISVCQVVVNTKKRPVQKGGKKKSGVSKRKVQAHESMYYHLKDDIRKEVLTRFASNGKLRTAIHANPVPEDEQTVLQSMFTACLLEERIDLNKMDLERLNALNRIADWLSPQTGFKNMPGKKVINRHIQISAILSSFKGLTGKYIDGKFVEHFGGRLNELARLRSYVGVVEPKGAVETIERFLFNPFRDSKKPPLLIFGIGGVGKSSLVAKFILQHAEAHQRHRFPFVYLDFDRPNLIAEEPETLLVEAARQLAIQYPDPVDFQKEAEAFYSEWKGSFNIVQNTLSSVKVTLKSDEEIARKVRNREKMRTAFVQLLNRLSAMEEKPFLVVLDTFEEVQYKGQSVIDELYRMLIELREKFQLLRVVLAGRAPISQFKTETIELRDLDQGAAQGFLLNSGVASKADAAEIAKKVGGNPLTLRLAVEVIEEGGMKAFNSIKTTKKEFGIIEQRLSQLEIQGILYKRILGHIHDPRVYKLAHPGLVLRFLSPDLIQNVLAAPCHLKVSSGEEAMDLFNEMSREVSLVVSVGENMLRHRQDVRRVMLNLIERDDPVLVKEIRTAAVKYYERLNGLESRAEEIYYRLALRQKREVVDARWIDGVQQNLLSSAEELPDKAQAYLAARTGLEHARSSIWENADMADKERILTRRVADFLNSGRSKEALNLLKKSRSSNTNTILSLFEVKALIGTGSREEALTKASDLLNRNMSGTTSEIREELSNYVRILSSGQNPSQSGSGPDEQTQPNMFKDKGDASKDDYINYELS